MVISFAVCVLCKCNRIKNYKYLSFVKLFKFLVIFGYK